MVPRSPMLRPSASARAPGDPAPSCAMQGRGGSMPWERGQTAKETGMAETQSQVQIQLQLDDATANGAYVNMAMLNHNEKEFTIDRTETHSVGKRTRQQRR